MDLIDFTPTCIPRGCNIEIYKEIDKEGYRKHEFVFAFLYDNKYPSAWHVAIPYEQIAACFRPMEKGDADPRIKTSSGEVDSLFTPEEIRGYKERWEMYRSIKKQNEEDAIKYLESDE